jgi:peptide/nickel transport system substrate-binding protein
MVLQTVPSGWAPAPFYKKIDIRITTASTASLLQSGDINVGEFGFTNQQANSMASDQKLTVMHANTPEFMMFAIAADPGAGPLHDPKVRQAIAYALPYDSVLKNVFFNRARRDLSIVSAGALEYTPAWSMYNTDLTKAKALMASAGNPKVTVPFLYQQGDEDQQRSALLIQANLKTLGITTQLTPVPRGGLFDALDARSTPAKGAKIGPPGVVLFNWSAWIADPKVVIGYWATSGGINNYSLWSSPVVDAINAKYQLAPTSAARTAGYKKAQTLIAEGAANLPMINTGRNVVLAHGLTGASFTPQPGMRFWTLHPTGQASALDALFTTK